MVSDTMRSVKIASASIAQPMDAGIAPGRREIFRLVKQHTSREKTLPRRALRQIEKLRGSLFSAGDPILVARAPARLDVMGGIADYSGSLVLEWPLAQATVAAIQSRSDALAITYSFSAADLGLEPEVAVPLENLCASDRTYAEVADLFAKTGKSWAGYVLGCVAVLVAEGIMPAPARGLSIAVCSDVSIGSGVASSASLEVAAMSAIAAHYQLQIEPLRLARLCQIVENHVVGAPCGIMDQVTASLGRKDHLLAIRCRPHEIVGDVRIPDAYGVFGLVSGVRHSVGGNRYGRTRAATFMGKKIIEAATGQRTDYLTRYSPADYRETLHKILPPRIKGGDFLDKYGRTDDDATAVEPDVTYSVRPCTRHPIYENARVAQFAECIEHGTEPAMMGAGKLMYASHHSYGRWCGMGCRETDLLVRLVRELGPAHGLYGAKITGGGCGGTVAVLARADACNKLKDVASQYQQRTGLEAEILRGSSDGAAHSPVESIN